MQSSITSQPQTYAAGASVRQVWLGSPEDLAFDEAGMRARLLDLSQMCSSCASRGGWVSLLPHR
jgi:hypothetical protein